MNDGMGNSVVSDSENRFSGKTYFYTIGFSVTFPFDVLEIYMFIFVGVVCGFGGAFYVYSHRR